MSIRAFAMLIVWLAAAADGGPTTQPSEWDGQLLRPAGRERIYEFAREPAVRKVGKDAYEIRFASKGACDVAGALAKFPPDRGRLIASFGNPVKLTDPPDRPADFINYGLTDRVWARNMLWCHPGLDMVYFVDPWGTGYACGCAVSRFDTDPYGRCFVPKAYSFSVDVLDTNGNPVCRIGRYGNCDNPPLKGGATDIGIADCNFVATDSDRWLYLNDDANLRIIRLKLGYYQEQRVPLGEGVAPHE